MTLSAFANQPSISSMDNVSVFFLAEGEQSGDDVMTRLVTFIRAAKQTLAFAIYDMRFSDPLRAQLAAALRDRAEAGLEIRFCYDADKPAQPDLAAGQDPAPAGTGAFVQSLGYPWRRIAGMKLMHSKFVVRDGQAVWTGSANMRRLRSLGRTLRLDGETPGREAGHRDRGSRQAVAASKQPQKAEALL